MTAVPRDIAVYTTPGEHTFIFPDWARWMIVTARGADGGAGSDGKPRKPGELVTLVEPVSVPFIRMGIDRAGRDFDGVRRGQNASIAIELFELRPPDRGADA